MSLEKMNDLVGCLLKARTVAHVEHWATDSYAKHMALGTFYEEITDLLDTLVESYQGYYDERIDPPIEGGKPERDIAKELDDQLELVSQLRYEAIPKDETCLQNLIDEIESLYQTTIYKLRFLK